MATIEQIEHGEAAIVPEENGHSLPTHHDMEGETVKRSSGRKKTMIFAVTALVLIGAIIGLSVGFVTKGDDDGNQVSSASQSQNSPATDPDDNLSVFDGPGDGGFVPKPGEDDEAGQSEEEPKAADPETESEQSTEAQGSKEAASATTPSPTPAPTVTTVSTTAEPTKAPTTDTTSDATATTASAATPTPDPRLAKIFDFLVLQGIVERSELESEGTYVNKAAHWIANEDELVLPVPGINTGGTAVSRNATSGTASTDETFITRFVLASVYFATSGHKWKKPLNFLSSKPTCEWYDSIDGLLEGVGCTPDGHVRILFLSDNNLKSKLPPEIGHLTNLVMLDMDRNWLQGNIPDTFASLASIEHLHLGSNGLQGPLPTWIGTLTGLRTLNLGFNTLDGPVPSELTTMPVLEELALDHNLLNGNINAMFTSSVAGLSPLKQLYLDSNAFSGPLDEGFLANMDTLKQLDLSDNNFSGTMPTQFFTLPNLLVLDVHDNSFTSLPGTFPVNSTLEFFAAQKNGLTGSIPESIVELADLSHLDLSQNKLTGTIPRAIGEVLVGLNYLFLAENDFIPGPIPFTVSNLFRLKELSLKSTARTGAIPNVMGLLTELVFLDLDNNSLEGPIPSMLGSLTNLKLLLLNRNNLTQEVPSELGRLSQLEVLYLEGNALTGGLNSTCTSIPMDREVEIIAQCNVCSSSPGCCTKCCEEGDACNTKTYVADLDPVWQLSYERDDYTLNAEDWWMA